MFVRVPIDFSRYNFLEFGRFSLPREVVPFVSNLPLYTEHVFIMELSLRTSLTFYRNNTLKVLCTAKLNGGKCLRNHNGTTQCFVRKKGI